MRAGGWTAAALGALLVVAAAAGAEERPADAGDWWSLHFQQTEVWQHHGAFDALYSGKNSLSPEPESKLSVTATLFAGARLWNAAGAGAGRPTASVSPSSRAASRRTTATTSRAEATAF